MRFNKLEVTYNLECGCVLNQTYKEESGSKLFMQKAVDTLSYWLENRVHRHKCELVTFQNPSGIE